MVIATAALYLLAIVVILGISVKLFWLMFILFLYRGYSSILSYEFLSKTFEFTDQWIYFVIILTLSVLTYGVIWRFLREVLSLQFLLFGALVLWSLTHYELADIMFFKDFFEAHGLWGLEELEQQFKEVFTTGPEGFLKLLETIFKTVWEFFEKIVGYLSGELNKQA